MTNSSYKNGAEIDSNYRSVSNKKDKTIDVTSSHAHSKAYCTVIRKMKKEQNEKQEEKKWKKKHIRKCRKKEKYYNVTKQNNLRKRVAKHFFISQ